MFYDSIILVGMIGQNLNMMDLIDWPGLNPDGTCEGRRLVCQEQ